MKKRILLICAVASAVLSVSAVPQEQGNAEKKLKVGFFAGTGARGGGVFRWARLLGYSPNVEMTLLDGQDIRDGKLKGLDLVLFPGGSSEHEYQEVKEEGAEKIREFVRNGGHYVGICAGFHCSLASKTRFRLLPYTYYRPAVGRSALVAVEFSKEGAARLGIKPGMRWVTYASGPIAKPIPGENSVKVEELCVYRSAVTRVDNSRQPSFSGFPGALFGKLGKGNVMVTSFHSEYRNCNDDISVGMIRAASGVKIRPQFPRKNYRPLRVAMFASAIAGKEAVRRMFELDKHPDIDLSFINATQVADGILDHADVFFVPDGNDKWFKTHFGKKKAVLTAFLKRGGKILVSGKGEAEILKPMKKAVFVPENVSAAEVALKK